MSSSSSGPPSSVPVGRGTAVAAGEATLSAPGAPVVPVAQRVWQRHTFGQRLARWLIWLAIVAAIVQAMRSVEVIPEFLLDAPEQMQDMMSRMWPVDWGYYPKGVQPALIETLHIATVGTVLAVFLAIPFGLMAARNFTGGGPGGRLLNFIARLVLVSSRSVNSLVWALLFVAVFGPGALAGTLAIAFRSIGFVGKLIGEAMEEVAPGPIEALTAAGASRTSVLLCGFWPAIKPAFWSVALLRWDINVRESAVLGLVGAGGIGMALDTALNLFQWQRVATVLVAIFVVVVIAEVVVTIVRRRLL